MKERLKKNCQSIRKLLRCLQVPSYTWNCSSKKGWGQGKILEERASTVFHSLLEMINWQIQEAQSALSKRVMMQTIPRNIIIKLLKSRDKILKGIQSKRNILHTSGVKMTANFLFETTKARRHTRNIIKVVKILKIC